MLNANMVNAHIGCSRARIFAFFFLFWADFYFSKIPLNMEQYLKLTKSSSPRTAAWSATIKLTNNISALRLNAYSRLFCYITSNSKKAPQLANGVELARRVNMWLQASQPKTGRRNNGWFRYRPKGASGEGPGSPMKALKPLGCLELEIARALKPKQGACEGSASYWCPPP